MEAQIIMNAIAQNPEFMNNAARVKEDADRTRDEQLKEINNNTNGFIAVIIGSPFVFLLGRFITPTAFLGFLQSAVVICMGLWLIQIGLTVGAHMYNAYNLYQGIGDLLIRAVWPALAAHVIRQPQGAHPFVPDILLPEQQRGAAAGGANPAEAVEVFMKVCDAFASEAVATFPMRHDDEYTDLRAGELEEFAYVLDDVRNNPQTKATMRQLFAPYSPQSTTRNPFTMRTVERVRKIAVWRAPADHDNADFERRLTEYEAAMRDDPPAQQEPAQQEPAQQEPAQQEPAQQEPAQQEQEQVITPAEFERRLAAFRAAPVPEPAAPALAPAVPQLATVDDILNMLNARRA